MHDDRHGRLHTADSDPRRRPPGGFRVQDGRRFRQLLDDALLALPAPAATRLTGAAIEVGDVPAEGDLAGVTPGEPGPGPAMPVARARGDGELVRHLVVYRRPAEQRATGRDDLVEVLSAAVLVAIAGALGIDPQRWQEP